MSKVKYTTVYETADGYIRIQQTTKRNFVVTYGLQVKSFDNWLPAFHEFGECLAHYLECESKLESISMH